MNVVRINSDLAVVPSMIVAIERNVWGDTRRLEVDRGSVYIVTPFGGRLDVLIDAPTVEVDAVYEKLIEAIEADPG